MASVKTTPEVRHPAYTYPVIPERNVIFLPLETDMELLCSSNDLIEIPNDGITLSLGDPNNRFYEAWIEEERFPARHRMGTDNRMFGNDRLATHWASECP